MKKVEQEKYEDIGIIKQSLLKPIQFNKTQKGIWVLLDGSQIEKSTKLFELLAENFDLDVLSSKDGKYYLPNALGVFIRCSNVNGKGSDPEKERIIGSTQKDGIKSHDHTYWGGKGNVWNKAHRYDGNHPSERNQKETKTHGDKFESETRPINISMYTYIKISN